MIGANPYRAVGLLFEISRCSYINFALSIESSNSLKYLGAGHVSLREVEEQVGAVYIIDLTVRSHFERSRVA
jgi:hypothetical protein